MPDPVLAVSSLCKRYGQTVAVDRISFRVEHNEIVGLLGPNGAGKTTTINMILGVLQPDSGVVRIDGVDLASRRSQALQRTNFAAVYSPLPGNLTVAENLRFFGMIYGVPALSERIEALLGQFDLVQFRNTRCGVLSSGEQTRVSLAKALLNRPRLLLLDEPTASLDPATARDLRTKIRNFTREGDSGVLWTSHNMNEVRVVDDEDFDKLRSPVVDETGLTGLYDFSVQGDARETQEFLALLRDQLGLVVTPTERSSEMTVVRLAG